MIPGFPLCVLVGSVNEGPPFGGPSASPKGATASIDAGTHFLQNYVYIRIVRCK